MAKTFTRLSPKSLPPNGSIVEIRTKRKGCSCGGYERKECYYEDGTFSGIRNPDWILEWRLSESNELVKEVTKRKCYVAVDCGNCLN